MPDANIHFQLIAKMAPGLLLASLMASCSTGDWLNKPSKEVPETPKVANAYLATMDTLSSTDPAGQAELFQQIYQSYQEAPTTGHRLQLALAYAAPGHANYDPQEAQQLLSQLQASPETLSPIERQLVSVELTQVEQALILRSENDALRGNQEREVSQLRESQQQQVQRLNAEINTLRRQLNDAQQKLDAISSLERSIIPGNGQEIDTDN